MYKVSLFVRLEAKPGKENGNRSPLYVVGSNDGTGAPRR